MTIRVFTSAVLLAAALPLAAADTTPPVITPNVAGALGQNGWYTSDVAISWDVSDPDSPILSSTGCEAALLTEDTTGTTYTCSATSEGGTATVSYVVQRDATAPSVGYNEAPARFGVDAAIFYSCNISEATSGLASVTCNSVTGTDAYDFNVGENVLTSTATDNAGSTGSGSVTFTVVVDAAGMSALVDRFVTSERVARGLKRHLNAGHVDQFVRAVNRESGDTIAPDDAATLVRLAPYLR